MGYVKSSDGTGIPQETIAAMARLLGLAIPPDDLPGLTAAVSDQFESVMPLEVLDLTDVMPAIEFDPRWEGGHDEAR